MLFDPVKFEGRPLAWTHLARTTDRFPGYYHWHQCSEMLFVHEGKGSVIVNQRTYEIRRGMLYLFQPYQLHKVYAEVSPETPYVRSILHFDAAMLSEELRLFPARHGRFRELLDGQSVQQAFDLEGEGDFLEHTLDQFVRGMGQGGGEGRREEAALLLLKLLDFMRPADGHTPVPPRPSRYSETIMQWLESHYREDVTLERIAEQTHLSKFYLSRVFRQETGSSLTDYLTARRIKQACRLLQTTSLPVDRIGAEVGMPNVSYFIQVFKKVVGTTPLKYRNRN
nr:AraC family transcriptional regulator [Cohnella sp. CFH 77786]